MNKKTPHLKRYVICRKCGYKRRTDDRIAKCPKCNNPLTITWYV